MPVTILDTFQNPRFLSVFIFGLVIIILYAKDKFNMPTYDKDAMGPFSRLSPQALTVDARYRQGRTIYLTMMVGLYVAICLLGPATFPHLDILKSAAQFGSQFQLGPQGLAGNQPNDQQIWPIIAATFLVSSAASSDDSIIGRIELYIRQYAHKAAFIPSAVSNLAFSLRNMLVGTWIKNPYLSEEQQTARQNSLELLIGKENYGKLNDNPNDESTLSSWARANILFYTLKQIFDKSQQLTSTRLDYLTDLQENRQIRDQLESTRKQLRLRFDAGGGVTQDSADPLVIADANDKLIADIHRFSKDVSLTIAVLLSQTARNAGDLGDRLGQVGFHRVDLPERSDHFSYVALVYAFIGCGVIISTFALYFILPILSAERKGSNQLLSATDYFPGLITIFSGCIIYLVVFRVTDYLRDRALESLDWTEGLGGYVGVAMRSAIFSSLGAVILITICFSVIFGGVSAVWSDFTGLLQQFIFQFVIAIIGAAFALAYLHQAAQTRRENKGLLKSALAPAPWAHAFCAALFVAGMGHVIFQSTMNKNIVETEAVIDAFYNSALTSKETLEKKENANGIYTKILETAKSLQPILKNEITSPVADSPSNANVSISDPKRSDDIALKVGLFLKEIKANCAALNTITIRLNERDPSFKQAYELANKSGLTLLNKPFADQEKCAPNSIPLADPGETPILGLANSLFSVYAKLNTLYYILSDPGSFRRLIFPILASALIAFFFGWGCLHWRVWWLYEGVKGSDGVKFQEAVAELYNPDPAFFHECLVTPIGALNGITPLEALRYEEYRGKLFRRLYRKEIPEFFSLKVGKRSPDMSNTIAAVTSESAHSP